MPMPCCSAHGIKHFTVVSLRLLFSLARCQACRITCSFERISSCSGCSLCGAKKVRVAVSHGWEIHTLNPIVREPRRGSSSVPRVAARAIYLRVEWLRRHRGTQPPALQRPGPAPGIWAIVPPKVDRIWGIWGLSYNIPKAIFYLLKGDCRD